MTKKLLIILQNAYGVEDGYVPSYDKESFRNCHTGRRLKRVLPANIEFTIINSSPLVGDNPDSIFKPDINYLSSFISTYLPTLILACGENAKKAVKELDIRIPVLFMPHPAYRCLTNHLLDEKRGEIERMFY